MPATKNVNLERVHVDGVDRFEATLKKDGVAWDLSAGSVVLGFKPPNGGTVFERDMVTDDASTGVFYYDTVVTDVTVTGLWELYVTVTDGSVVKTYPYKITFKAVDQT